MQSTGLHMTLRGQTNQDLLQRLSVWVSLYMYHMVLNYCYAQSSISPYNYICFHSKYFRVCPNLGQSGPEWDTSGTTPCVFQYILDRLANIYCKLVLKVPNWFHLRDM